MVSIGALLEAPSSWLAPKSKPPVVRCTLPVDFLVSIFLAYDPSTVHEPDASVQVCREREPGAVRSHGVGGLAIRRLAQNKLHVEITRPTRTEASGTAI